MKRSRFTEQQIFAILKEAEAGPSVKEVCRRYAQTPCSSEIPSAKKRWETVQLG